MENKILVVPEDEKELLVCELKTNLQEHEVNKIKKFILFLN